MALFIVYGHGSFYKDKFDNGMSVVNVSETTMENVEKWNKEDYKNIEGGIPVQLEFFKEDSKDTKFVIRRFSSSEYNRWIELYAFGKDLYNVLQDIEWKFIECWRRW